MTRILVKICFSDMNGFLLATGPDWKVVLVNVDEKLIYEASYADFMAHKIRRSYLGGWDSAHDIPVKKLRKTNYAGQDCELFGFPENFHRKEIDVANFFQYPKNYKHVKSELDLFSSRDRTTMMEDVYKDAAEPLSIRKH